MTLFAIDKSRGLIGRVKVVKVCANENIQSCKARWNILENDKERVLVKRIILKSRPNVIIAVILRW